MKLKKTILACLLMSSFLSVSAQDQQPKTEYVPNPYWYVQVQGGAQYTLGEIDFGDLISPNVQLAFGRQFNPVFGARLAVNAWQSRAGWEFKTEPVGTMKWKWMYVAPGIDLTFNLSNLFCGYNPNRLFNFSVFVGGGVNIGWDFDKEKNVEHAELLDNPARLYGAVENLDYAWTGTKVRGYGRLGIAGDFRINDQISVGLEVNANTLSDRYNGKKAGNWDWYFNALAGVKINLGQTYSTRTVEAPKPQERVIEKVIERVVEKPAPQALPTAAAVVKKSDPFRRDIFFKIGKISIQGTEAAKVKEVADYMKANPSVKVEVTGYADRGTGNARINKSLSERRAQIVSNELTKKYGISASRIIVDSKGDTVQPFAKNEENRVTICIAE